MSTVHFPGWFAAGRFSTLLVAFDALGIIVFGYAMKKTGSIWPPTSCMPSTTCSQRPWSLAE